MPNTGGVMTIDSGFKAEPFAREKKAKRPVEERVAAMRTEYANLIKKRLKKNLGPAQARRLETLARIIKERDEKPFSQ